MFDLYVQMLRTYRAVDCRLCFTSWAGWVWAWRRWRRSGRRKGIWVSW